MSRFILLVVGFFGVVIVLSLSGFLGKEFARHLLSDRGGSPSSSGLEASLQEAVDDVNEAAPMQLDEMPRLDGAMVSHGSRIIYFYTLTAFDGSQVRVDELNSAVSGGLIDRVCASEEIRSLLEAGAGMVYRYSGRSGEFLFDVEVWPGYCP